MNLGKKMIEGNQKAKDDSAATTNIAAERQEKNDLTDPDDTIAADPEALSATLDQAPAAVSSNIIEEMRGSLIIQQDTQCSHSYFPSAPYLSGNLNLGV